MGNLNKVMLIGRLGKDPEVRITQHGKPVANFSMATSENWIDSKGQKQERTEWIPVACWDKVADVARNFLKQGSKIYVEGSLKTRSWDDSKTGQKRYKTEVVAKVLQMLDSRETAQGHVPHQSQNTVNSPRAFRSNQQVAVSDDIPF